MSSQQQSILDSAWKNRNNVPNNGHLGWDTSRTSIPSNKYYQWTPDKQKYGQHYYYKARELWKNQWLFKNIFLFNLNYDLNHEK